MNTKNERLRDFRRYLKLNQGEMSNDLGVNRTVFSRLESGDYELKAEHIKNMLIKHKLNPVWLLTGEGEMLLNQEKNTITPLQETKINLPANRLYQVPVHGIAEAGYIVGYGDEAWTVYKETCVLPPHNEHLTRGFTVHGSSMEYILSSDDVILCRRILDVASFSFHSDHIYVLVTVDGIIVKHINKRENGFQVRSANPKYTPYFVPFEDIIEIWKAEMKLSTL